MGFYSSEGLLVETYDASTPDVGDLSFYREMAGGPGGPVLDLGCGTGRLSWALAEAGHEVVGIDLSGPMLRRAEAKRAEHPTEVGRRVRFERGDMTRLHVAGRFRFVACACRAFQALLTPEEQRSCVRGVWEHLEPGALFVLDLFDPRLDRCIEGAVEPPAAPPHCRHPVTGREVRFEFLERKNDALRQVLHEVWRLTELDAHGGIVRQEESALELRWTYRREMRYLLELCGFAVEAEYGDFHRSPPRHGGEQVWVARRRPAPPGPLRIAPTREV